MLGEDQLVLVEEIFTAVDAFTFFCATAFHSSSLQNRRFDFVISDLWDDTQ